MVNVYKGKGDALTCGSYNGHKAVGACDEGFRKSY